MADSDNDSGGVGNNGSSGEERDKLLPMANVDRIMRKALPANAKIKKDAKEAVQKCVSEFIHLLTGEASKKCKDEKRKTINADDHLEAMETLGFDEHIDHLKLYQEKYQEFEGKKQGTGTGAPGGGGSASSSSSQPTDVLGGGVNVGGSHRAGLYGGGAGAGSGMMGMGQHQQHQLGSGFFRGSSGSGSGGSSGGSSSPSIGKLHFWQQNQFRNLTL